MSLKEEMEKAWKLGGCENPLEPAKWRLTTNFLAGRIGAYLVCLNSLRWNYFH